MLMVRFFEDLSSQRAIASRCDDSRAIREFLGYGLTEATPEQSSFTVIRRRLPRECVEAVHRLVFGMLHTHGLLRGRSLGIDSSVIEVSASLRGLENRNTEEAYWEYVRKLSAEAGIDPSDTKAVRRFDWHLGGGHQGRCKADVGGLRAGDGRGLLYHRGGAHPAGDGGARRH